MGLIAQKLAAALLLTGDAVEGALVQQTDSGRGSRSVADLAKSVISGAQVADLNSLFRERSHEGRVQNDYLGVTRLDWTSEPEEEELILLPPPVHRGAYQQLPLL